MSSLDNYLGKFRKQEEVTEKDLIFNGADYSCYEVFDRKIYTALMPEVVSDNFVIADFCDLLLMRLCFNNDFWRFNHFDSCTGVAYNPNGEFKIVHDCDLLKSINPKTKLINGALPLSESVYYSLEGKTFSKEDRLNFTEKYLTENNARTNRVWLELAKNNQNLLDNTTETAFKYLKDECNVDKGMRVVLSSTPKNYSLRAWLLGRFGYGCNDGWSSAVGCSSLVNCNARLVRVGGGAAFRQ